MDQPERLVNRSNFHLTNKYLGYLLDTKNLNEQSVSRYRFYLRHLLLWAMDQPFEQADLIAPIFPRYLHELEMAPSSQKKVVETSRAFFRWAKLYQSKRFARLPAYWIEDLTPPRFAAPTVKEYVSLDEIKAMASFKIDRENLALWRDQAMAALLFLTGARAGAATTLPIKAVHLDEDYPYIEQKPELGVKTKNKKSATTFLHNIPELLVTVRAWDGYVKANCPDDHPWYAPIEQHWGEQRLSQQRAGANRHIAVNKRLAVLDRTLNLAHRSPHKYRHGYAIYGLKHCHTMAQYHALSRNLMHANLAITDEIYVHLEEQERGRLLYEISTNTVDQQDDELRAYLAKLDRESLGRAITIAADLMVAR